MSGFLADDYEPPVTSNYMQFEDGENRFRILGTFVDNTGVMGTSFWVTTREGKRQPIRLRMGEQVPMDRLEINPRTGDLERPKHFWMLPVWNYSAKRIQLLEITQKTVIDAIKSLSRNAKWGDPRNYDLVVTRLDENGKITYSTVPDPKEAISEDIKTAFKSAVINYEAVFKGGDPFVRADVESNFVKSDENVDSETLPF